MIGRRVLDVQKFAALSMYRLKGMFERCNSRIHPLNDPLNVSRARGKTHTADAVRRGANKNFDAHWGLEVAEEEEKERKLKFVRVLHGLIHPEIYEQAVNLHRIGKLTSADIRTFVSCFAVSGETLSHAITK